MNIPVRRRENEEIWAAADTFRASERMRGHSDPPIDVIYVAEVRLKLNVIPIRDLFAEQRIDAALLPDLSGIYIDEDAYLGWEAGRKWMEKRLRFSFAHELGHFILHEDEILENRFKTTGEFKQWARNRVNYQSAEYQADEFAGRFLVPRETLELEFSLFRQRMEAAAADWRGIQGIREHFADKVAVRFGVNKQVIEIRLDRERIWPAE